jgi:hypothetical protein
VLLFLLFGFASTLTYSQESCRSDLQLVSKIKSIVENSVEVEITTDSNFTCTIYQFTDGEYLKLSQRNGSGKSSIKFSSLDPSGVFRVIAKFENKSMFCRLRQIGGISL